MNRMTNNLKVACRDSALSLRQTEEALSFFPEFHCRVIPLRSFGDKNKHIPLTDAVAPDFFTRELDEALLAGKADVAVHSAKDLPYPMPAGLEVFALLEATDKTDAWVSRNNLTPEQLPAGARVGTSSAARKAGLLALRPDLEMIPVRGTIEERIAQVDSGCIDALIVATCALKRLGLEKRIAAVLDFDTHPLQGHLAVTGRQDRQELKERFARKDIRRHFGKVTLVGFGPGNPDLLTIGGDKALREAGVIFHDDLLDARFLSRYTAEKIYVGKRKDMHRFHQGEINEMVYRAAVSGKQTVRLKGGDPMIFAHGREEIDFLQSRLLKVEVIPGISAGNALAACTHIPLTHRGTASSVAFVAGQQSGEVQTPNADTVIYYMGGANIPEIARKMLAAGRREDLPVALVHNVSLPGQTTYYSTLKELQHSVILYPTPILMIAGDTVAFEHHAANRQKVLVTGTSRNDYSGRGEVTHTPLIRIDKITENSALHASIRKIDTFDWIIFTSRYGVRYFFEALDELKTDVRALSGVRLASTGKTTTAELGKYRLYPDVEAASGSAEGLIRHFRETGLANQRILLPRSGKGLKYLPEELEKLGNRTVDIPVYRNTFNGEAKTVDLAQFRKIIFSSPSGVEAFVRLYEKIPPGTQLVARGATTEKKLKEAIGGLI
ncbi:MAG: uroporphyrinogen-III C-methyltransferase [Bacteroidales bacterium]|jgi:uroporphyrinogen III methyltransferase/synthase|nr:uroporphyrinogen-III C-methyltransferase [Bacteroidales bacterium]